MTQRADHGKSGDKSGSSGARAQRLKAALRENLRRRKAQERARKLAPAADERSSTDPSDPDKR